MAGKSGSKEKSGMKTGEDDLDFRAVTDASLNGIIVFQGEDIVYVNRAAAEIVGYTRDELLCMKFWEVMHPDFQDPVRKHGLSMQRGESAASRVEVKVAGKNGRERWVDAYSSLIEYHGRPAALISVVDITERKQAEEALRQREADLAMAQEIARIGSWVWDFETDKIAWSDQLYRILGLAPQSVTPSAGLYLDYVHPDDRKRSQADIEYGKAKGSNSTETRMLLKDGSTIDTVVVTRPIFSDGKLVRIYGVVQDITEHKKLETTLKQKEKHLQEILGSIQEGFFELDRDWRFTYINERAARNGGFEPGELIGERIWEKFPYMVGSQFETVYREVMDTRRQVRFEIKSPGREVWYEVSVYPSAAGISGFWRDITERKRADEALRESEERFRALANNIPNMAWMANAGGEIFWFNEQWYDYTGTTLEVMRDWGWLKVHHPDYAHKVKEKWLSSIEAGRPHENVAYLRGKDGNYRWFLTRVTPIRDGRGDICRWFGTNTDITERKLAEDALREMERQLAESQVLTDTGSWEMDLATGDVTFSDNMLRIVGLPPGRHTYDEFQALVHPQDQERRDAAVKDSINGKRFDIEYRLVRPDGDVRQIHAIGSLTRDTDDKPGKFIVTIQDVTERKRAEEALREAKAQAELYLDLMGHDINNINLAAMGFLELALKTLEAEKRLRLEDKLLIERPLVALQGSSKLIGNVRKLQRLMNEGIKTMPIDLGEVLREIDVQSFNRDGREIAVNIPQVHDCTVEANELLRDVFLNLITNAVKHSDEGKLLTIDVKVKPVEENGRMYYMCAVEDNGPGIPDDLKPKLFNRLTRGTTKAYGKGLGLYLVRTLLEGYGGDVWVEDRVKGDYTKGARFVVILPSA